MDSNKLESFPLETERNTLDVAGGGSDIEASVLDEILSVESEKSTSKLDEGSASGQQQKEVTVCEVTIYKSLTKSKQWSCSTFFSSAFFLVLLLHKCILSRRGLFVEVVKVLRNTSMILFLTRHLIFLLNWMLFRKRYQSMPNTQPSTWIMNQL